MIVSQLKEGQAFSTWNGTVAIVVEKSVGRVRIKDESGSREVSLGMEIGKVLELPTEGSPSAAGKGNEGKEDKIMGAKLDALKAFRTGANSGRKPGKTKVTKTKAVKVPKVKKEQKAKSENGRASMVVFGHSVTSVIRWMGKDGFTFAEAVGALTAVKTSPMPANGTISIQLGAGKRGERGDPAKLTAEQQKELRDAAKVVADEAKAEKEVKAAK